MWNDGADTAPRRATEDVINLVAFNPERNADSEGPSRSKLGTLEHSINRKGDNVPFACWHLHIRVVLLDHRIVLSRLYPHNFLTLFRC